MQDYKKLIVWEKAHNFTVKIYELLKVFPKEEIFGLTSQLKRAAISIPANIAEGTGRSSNTDFARFLNISLGPLNEVSYYILLAKDLHYITENNYMQYDMELNELKAMLLIFLKKVRNN
jgi:four helix bundle protein